MPKECGAVQAKVTLRMTPKLLALRQSSTVVGAQPMEASMAPLPCLVARSSTAASTVFREAWREALLLAFFSGRTTESVDWECLLFSPSPFACNPHRHVAAVRVVS